jgi:hypothetical protein
VLHGLVEAGLHPRLEALAGQLADDADPHPADVGARAASTTSGGTGA